MGIDALFESMRKAFIEGAIAPILQGAFGSDGVVDDLATLLSASNSVYDRGFGYAERMITNVIQPIGIALIITFFLINIMTTISRDSLTLDSLIKQLIMLVVIFTFATQATAIGKSVLNVGDVFLKQTADQVGLEANGEKYEMTEDASQKAKAEQNVLEAADGLVEDYKGIGALCIACILWIVAKISQVGMYAAVISRGIELIWRTMFMPIGLANSFEGANSPGVRYLKTYIGVALSGGMMIVIITVGYDLVLGILGNGQSINGLMRLLMAGAGLSATAGAAMGASSKIKEVFG